MEENIRMPRQKRAIEKREKIIDAGFTLICQNGYYNTNTAEIAKTAGVSTGIVYQYFKDKYDIFLEGLEKYGDEIFFPMLKIDLNSFKKDTFENTLRNMINIYINDHKLSKTAHEEITSMIHSNKDVADYFYKREMLMTETLVDIFLKNGFNSNHLIEKVHVMLGMIDNLCHEVIYHQHDNMDYNAMTDIVITNITSLFE
ncbi:MAG: TetR/AcrR family transcriptional regulator [Bacilli bacterium]|nr:TetR/AcrR family transcriptional regulator [Bacilli bacterium]